MEVGVDENKHPSLFFLLDYIYIYIFKLKCSLALFSGVILTASLRDKSLAQRQNTERSILCNQSVKTSHIKMCVCVCSCVYKCILMRVLCDAFNLIGIIFYTFM